MKYRMYIVAVNVIGLAVAISIAVLTGIHFESHQVRMPGSNTHKNSFTLSYLGVYEPTSPSSFKGVIEFSRIVGRQPQIAVYYSGWWEAFQVSFVQAANENHMLPMVQIEPSGISLAAIAAGQYDSYLTSYASAVRSYGHPVILSFGHEMNTDWYSWGYRDTPAPDFVAAWKHIHDLFIADGARNVRWLWTVNVVGGPHVRPISAWWPGSAYVTWVGIDGHYNQPSARFAELFGATLGQIRKLTQLPMLIAEAGIAPDVGITRITDLFAGAQAHGLLGVVWFDVPGHNLRIESNPAAIDVFRGAVGKYFRIRAVGTAPRTGTPAASERGLPPTKKPQALPTGRPAPPAGYPVARGDTLWSIAAKRRIRGGWRTLYQQNRGVIGGNPNLIRPGELLRP